jgi:hypothetical protein
VSVSGPTEQPPEDGAETVERAADDLTGAPVDPAGETPADAPPEVVRLEAAVADLEELDRLPVREHVARYDALHGELSDALGSIDEV